MGHSFETVVGELCDCGHEKRDHLDLLDGYAPGHGACKEKTCDCGKFTWASFIFAGREAENHDDTE